VTRTTHAALSVYMGGRFDLNHIGTPVSELPNGSGSCSNSGEVKNSKSGKWKRCGVHINTVNRQWFLVND
jgi:hypothetical protein